MKLLISVTIFSLVVQDVHPTGSSHPAMSNITQTLRYFTAVLTYNHQNRNKYNMENLLYSPISIAETLGMVMTGARGTTYENMKKYLLYGLTEEYQQTNVDNLFRKIRNKTFQNKKRRHTSDNATVISANRAYVQDSFEILPNYTATLKNSFRAEAELIDFGDSVEASGRINSWINKQTDGMIRDLIQSEDINPLTRLVLVNALYFSANWKKRLHQKETRWFYNCYEDRRRMNFIGGPLTASVIQRNGYSTVFLRYNSNVNTYMVINRLPTKSAWERFFEFNNLKNYFNETIIEKPRERRKVYISMPEFDFEVSTDLTNVLTDMGMHEMFDSNTANFSGIATGEDLHLSKIVHKAKISVNKDGTKAAAATGAIFLGRSASKTLKVVIDTPFVFSIVRNKHVLFFGAVKDLR